MTKRRRRTGKQRLAILDAHNRVCNLCGGAIDPVTQKWELDHENELEISCDDSDENLKPVHDKCHRKKKSAAIIAKAKRREVKHNGAAPPKQKIKSAPFAKAPKPERIGKLDFTKRRSLYQ